MKRDLDLRVKSILLSRVVSPSADEKAFVLLDDKNIKVEICEFTIEKKKKWLDLKDLIINEKSFKCEKNKDNQKSLDLRVIYSKYYANIFLLPTFKFGEYKTVDMFFKLVLGSGIGISKMCSREGLVDFGYCDHGLDKNEHRKIVLDNQLVERSSLIWKALNKDGAMSDKRVSLIYELLTYAYLSTSYGLKGALLVTVLESVLVQEKESDISYRFSMRGSKLNNDFSFKKRYQKLYNSRSVFFHSGQNNFNPDDLDFLEQQVYKIIADYIIEPSKFDPEKIDKSFV